MLRISTLLLLLIPTSNILAQSVSFEYDNAGNRVKRLASSPPRPGCDFNLSLPATSSATVSQSTTLTATCSGADCGGVSYGWSGNYVNGNGLSAKSLE